MNIVGVFLYCVVFCGSVLARDASLQIKIKGKIMIGGLFPVHQTGATSACGGIKQGKGIQRLEAMLFAVDRINNKSLGILPHLPQLGVHILDTCSQDNHALEQTLEFIKTAISSGGSEQYKCADGKIPVYQKVEPTVGVIGAASSQVSAMVANMLRLFKIPQISYSSTAAELSDKAKFEYFSRVVPSDTLQAQAMVDLVVSLGWNFVHAIFDEGNYGEKGIESFRKLANARDICVANSEKIPRKLQPPEHTKLLNRLKKDYRGVVMFVNEDNVKQILNATKILRLEHHFAFIASDSWGNKLEPVSRVEWREAAHGTITISPRRKDIKEFSRYFAKLRPENNRRNVWFEEFWRHINDCNSTTAIENCQGNLAPGHTQETYVPYVIDAVYLMAYALNRITEERCGSRTPCNYIPKVDGTELLYHIRNVSFQDVHGEEVALDRFGDRKGRYDIYQYNSTANRYEQRGEWAGSLEINISELAKGYQKGQIPTSICMSDCKLGEAKKYTTNQKCCWACDPCDISEFLPNETTCVECPIGQLPNVYRNGCVAMIPETMEWASLWVIIPVCFSVLGILSTGVVIYVFIRYNKTPIVMASGRELCYFMISGVMCSYAMTFVLVNPPSPVTCGILRIGLGLFMSLIYAAILTKTSRLARIFSDDIKTLQSPRFITPNAQVGICAGIVALQLLGATIWIIIDPPTTIFVYPTRQIAVLSCKVTATPLLLSLSYDMTLITLCTVYAFKTRKIPENFNETKYIGFTMYATCIVWLAFVPIYFATNHNFRIQTTSLCMCISISGTVTLCCFFSPKVYIVLFQPYKNVRERTLTSFQKLMKQHVNDHMNLVKEPVQHYAAPLETSQVSQGTFSFLSTTSVTQEHKPEEGVRGGYRTSFPRGNPRPTGNHNSLGPPLSPMIESVSTSRQSNYSDGDHPSVHSSMSNDREDTEPTELSPFLSTDVQKELLSESPMESLPEAQRELLPELHNHQENEGSATALNNVVYQKEAWVVSDARAEVEMILTEIATQRGTVV